ncbi:Intradiol ring-cleavage dioxygenase [Aspergillus granulosus]|uniref:Intradiol ring-cleavage dioxygenase n=1 Tax=Aspergillus granulosus TaxID=176169 RepID=A0ABR4H105_9EURO
MVRITPAALASMAIFFDLSVAHPGHDVKEEAAERAAFMERTPLERRSLSHCSATLEARGHAKRSIDRRDAMVKNLRGRLEIPATAPIRARSLESALATSHLSDLVGVTQDYDPAEIFTGNSTCVLADDTTEGPYYVSGEYVRSSISEDQGGVPLYMDIQIINSNTCEPEADIYMDLWHCNATGVYSGVEASGNGNGGGNNLDATFLRGIQKSDDDGVVYFQSVFPGHYTGRATHIHVLTHNSDGLTELENGTISDIYDTHSSHIGQLFFDQDLITQVELLSPYTDNTQQLTTNANDGILAGEAEDIDPFMEYVLLGDSLSDGIFAWISVAIDPTVDREVSTAAYYTEDGGVANGGSGTGGSGGSGSGGPGGSGPSGGF